MNQPMTGAEHRWVLAGLLAMGYDWKVASTIATRTLRKETLFPNEAEAAARVLAELRKRKVAMNVNKIRPTDDLPLDPIEIQLMDDAQAGSMRVDAPPVSAATHEHSDMRGQLPDVAAIRRYIEAGKATLTIVSKKTGTRYTLRFTRPKVGPGSDSAKPRPIWISVLSGQDNETAYTFLGTLWLENSNVPSSPLHYKHSPKSPASSDAPSVRAALWLLKVLNTRDNEALKQAEVWHEGRCGRCGRKLTVPSSIESGFGPECIGLVH